MANYPTSTPSFTNKSNGQTIDASHINSIQDEVVAIGGGLLNGLAHPLMSTSLTYTRIKQACVRAVSTGVLGIADNLLTGVSLGAEDFDTAGLHDNTINPSR